MTDKSDKIDKLKIDKQAAPSWTSAAALAGAAIGSAALAGALLYASRRKERAEKTTIPAPKAKNTPESEA